MQITQLHIYPVKSLRGIALDQAILTERGLAFDRQWMIVDDDNRFVTQRELAAMAQVRVRLTPDALVLEHDAVEEPLSVALEPEASAPRLEVRIFKDQCEAIDEGPEAARWLTRVLGPLGSSGLRLVRFPDEARRAIEPDYLRGEKAHTGFADGYAVLVTSDASLSALNTRLAEKGEGPVPMSRFRPNIVVAGGTAFDERQWDDIQLQASGVRLGLRKPCKRCKIITQDQRSGEAPSPKEPLKTLAEMDTQPGWKGAFFGQNAIPLAGVDAALRVGDVLSVMRRDP
ncbi:MOSC N-terminal beta barrel domain-containing protein [Halomonas sp. 18H]|uniref:MOSC domain-containing protein n=1 Tax=Halomonas almeriensis TaxID=308163 RepID=UPI00222EA041|nr:MULTISPECIES: MOSC N-terminal beta barrel domain-containing protein [Halomonas]MCW4149200.1 MOSC N-terminal beta barrel domain-containing protein [Halomonas sp. 18H]MDN3552250.1 MOSC N-terminal beta barrel domain-containing protein [Halomonas almeriensis]